mgnify:CR=1 FL=1
MIKKEVTIYDIAHELNVSPSTVSRALRDLPNISKSTKRKIKILADLRGYVFETEWRRQKLGVIGLIVPHIDTPLTAPIISGIEQVTSVNGFSITIMETHDCLENEITFAKSLLEAHVDGLIISPSKETTNLAHFKHFINSDTPIIFLNPLLEKYNSSAIIIDYYTAGYLATSHLIDQGCHRIAFIGETPMEKTCSKKLKGYLKALSDHNILKDENLIVTCESLDVKEGYECAGQLLNLSEPPDAVFTENDDAAVGIIQYAINAGLNVPHDLAVMGFNNDPISQKIDPPLSTVTFPTIEMGKIAAQEVVDQTNFSGIRYAKIINLNANLVIRNSTLKISNP